MLRSTRRAALLLAFALPAAAEGPMPTDPSRTIALGSGIADTVCELGACESLIAVDQSAEGLEAVAGLPQVGYFRALSLEPLLALSPGLVVASALAGPPSVLEGLARAGVKVVTVEETPTPEGLARKLAAIGEAVGLPEAGRAMAESTRSRLALLGEALAREERKVTAVYLLGVSGGGLMAAGSGTLADGLMRLAGLENAFSEAEGYKALAPELLLSLRPAVILMGERTWQAIGGEAGLKQQPALVGALAPGGSRLLRHDDTRLLGLGPHTADELVRIALATHPGIEAWLLAAGAGEESAP